MSYPNLRAEMARAGTTQVCIAKSLGINPVTLWMKIDERSPFSLDEAKKIQAEFFPDATLDYLFASDGNPAD